MTSVIKAPWYHVSSYTVTAFVNLSLIHDEIISNQIPQPLSIISVANKFETTISRPLCNDTSP